jgi:hypothetical protein
VTAEELLAVWRRRSDDHTGQEQFDDADLLRYLTEAEREACLRAKLLFDESSDFTQIEVVEGTATYTLDERIDRIDGASFTPGAGGRAYDLVPKGIDWIRDQCDWANRTGQPTHYCLIDRVLRVWPKPSSSGEGELQLRAYRFPLYPIDDLGASPEIPVEHHEGLLDWLDYRAHQTKDSEQGDESRSANGLAAFTDRFGERPDADTLRRHREQRRVTTRYGGY